MKIRIPLAYLTCVFAMLIAGCTNTGEEHDHDHDHEHHSETQASYSELIQQIVKYKDEIKTAFAADKKDDAHDPLHEIGHHIGKLPDAAAATDMAEADWNAVKEASDKLMASFKEVDKLFHGEEGANYDEIDADVVAAIAVLEEKAASVTSDEVDPQS